MIYIDDDDDDDDDGNFASTFCFCRDKCLMLVGIIMAYIWRCAITLSDGL